jgi:hypothetical protein
MAASRFLVLLSCMAGTVRGVSAYFSSRMGKQPNSTLWPQLKNTVVYNP